MNTIKDDKVEEEEQFDEIKGRADGKKGEPEDGAEDVRIAKETAEEEKGGGGGN